MKPTPARPKIHLAQVGGSGTALQEAADFAGRKLGAVNIEVGVPRVSEVKSGALARTFGAIFPGVSPIWLMF